MQTEFTKWEWFEVAQLAKPDITVEEYEVMWSEFAELKRTHGVHLVYQK